MHLLLSYREHSAKGKKPISSKDKYNFCVCLPLDALKYNELDPTFHNL